MQKVELTLMFTEATRKLFLSRMMRKPLNVMQHKINTLLGKTAVPSKELDKLKFMIYSAHDD